MVQACRLIQAHCSLEESSMIMSAGRHNILSKAQKISGSLESEKDECPPLTSRRNDE